MRIRMQAPTAPAQLRHLARRTLASNLSRFQVNQERGDRFVGERFVAEFFVQSLSQTDKMSSSEEPGLKPGLRTLSGELMLPVRCKESGLKPGLRTYRGTSPGSSPESALSGELMLPVRAGAPAPLPPCARRPARRIPSLPSPPHYLTLPYPT